MILPVILLLLATPAIAGEADVLAVEAAPADDGTWRFEVTVRHADAGWEHYADRWEILAPDGTVLAERVLLHRHDDEQPFTRDLPGVRIPDGVASVRVRAHDKLHEWGGREVEVELRR